ncbi:MAG: SRPBCC family protein [Ilumatobacteraceae bacterium]
MDVHASVEAKVTADKLFSKVSDLSTYTEWLDIVHRVEVMSGENPTSAPVWQVELRARVGPFARSKRLRMVRTSCEPSRAVVFERQESDGKQHSDWVLRATIDPTSTGSTLNMYLHYGGLLFTGGVMERLLADQIRHGSERLVAMFSTELN